MKKLKVKVKEEKNIEKIELNKENCKDIEEYFMSLPVQVV